MCKCTTFFFQSPNGIEIVNEETYCRVCKENINSTYKNLSEHLYHEHGMPFDIYLKLSGMTNVKLHADLTDPIEIQEKQTTPKEQAVSAYLKCNDNPDIGGSHEEDVETSNELNHAAASSEISHETNLVQKSLPMTLTSIGPNRFKFTLKKSSNNKNKEFLKNCIQTNDNTVENHSLHVDDRLNLLIYININYL